MRFCLVSTQPDWGGGEKLLWSFRTALLDQGHSIAWIARKGNPLHTRIIESGDELLASPVKRGANPLDWWRAFRGVRQYAPDALLMNDSHSIELGGSISFFLRDRRPLRVAFKHTIFPVRSRLKIVLFCDLIVCVSEAVRRVVLAKGISADRAAVVHGGCEPPVADPEARKWANLEFGLRAGSFLVVNVGNLLACKGQLDLVSATHAIRQWKPDVRVLIAGEGQQRAALDDRIGRLGLADCVSLLGFRNDADRLLAAADLVVQPSHSEGLSLVLIQAQMLCKPIVATAVGGAAEVLGVDANFAKSTWISQPGDIESLAQCMQRAISTVSDPNCDWLDEQLSVARQRALREFGISENARKLVELLAGRIEIREDKKLARNQRKIKA